MGRQSPSCFVYRGVCVEHYIGRQGRCSQRPRACLFCLEPCSVGLRTLIAGGKARRFRVSLIFYIIDSIYFILENDYPQELFWCSHPPSSQD
jgi:hypothetical protein